MRLRVGLIKWLCMFSGLPHSITKIPVGDWGPTVKGLIYKGDSQWQEAIHEVEILTFL